MGSIDEASTARPGSFNGITVESHFLSDGYSWTVTDENGSEAGTAPTEDGAWQAARDAQERRRTDA
jgi:hypothetical protein